MSALEQISMISNLLKIDIFSNLQKYVTLLPAILFGCLLFKKQKPSKQKTCRTIPFLNFHQTLKYLYGTSFLTSAVYLFSFS